MMTGNALSRVKVCIVPSGEEFGLMYDESD
jgi:hypothetical protein